MNYLSSFVRTQAPVAKPVAVNLTEYIKGRPLFFFASIISAYQDPKTFASGVITALFLEAVANKMIASQFAPLAEKVVPIFETCNNTNCTTFDFALILSFLILNPPIPAYVSGVQLGVSGWALSRS